MTAPSRWSLSQWITPAGLPDITTKLALLLPALGLLASALTLLGSDLGPVDLLVAQVA